MVASSDRRLQLIEASSVAQVMCEAGDEGRGQVGGEGKGQMWGRQQVRQEVRARQGIGREKGHERATFCIHQLTAAAHLGAVF